MKNFFRELLCDENSLSEKTFIGLCAFALIVITLTCDIITGFMGKEMPIHEFVFDGIMFIVLGAFFGTSLDKWISTKNKGEEKTETKTTENSIES
jgi:membrane-bound ClpP family serine protease